MFSNFTEKKRILRKTKVVDPQSSFNIVWLKTYFEDFLETIQTSSVFEKFTFKPEHFEKI